MLRSHRGRQHFHHRRALSLCVGCSSNFSHPIHSGFASLRSTQTQSQGLGRKTPKIAPLSTPSTGLFHLPCCNAPHCFVGLTSKYFVGKEGILSRCFVDCGQMRFRSCDTSDQEAEPFRRNCWRKILSSSTIL